MSLQRRVRAAQGEGRSAAKTYYIIFYSRHAAKPGKWPRPAKGKFFLLEGFGLDKLLNWKKEVDKELKLYNY
jgi:hypothetical protein